MTKEQAYECENCKGQMIAAEGAQTPQCCGREMKHIPMDQCARASTAEHSRFDEDDGPCDDGRAG